MNKQTAVQSTIERHSAVLINKNLGSTMCYDPSILTPATGEGLPVIPPTDKQKYNFDRDGWILIPSVLSEAEINEMRAFAAQLALAPDSVSEHERNGLGGPLQKLADHPLVVGFLNEFLAYPAVASAESYGFRLETSHLFHRSVKHEVQRAFHPHNGNGLFRPPWDSHYYRCVPGRAWCGLTRIVWELNPVQHGKGGTLFITGSHKAAYPAPESAHDPNSSIWDTYECPAGSLIIFTESTTHSATQWTDKETDRLAIFNLYNSVANRWTNWLPEPKLLETMPPLRQSLFRGVYTADNVENGTFEEWTSPFLAG